MEVFTKFLTDENGRIELGELGEDLVSLKRDVEEIHVLADFRNDGGLQVIALRDGALELFHQPRSDADFNRAFGMYQASLVDLHNKSVIIAGFIDQPRASMVVKMLGQLNPDEEHSQSGRGGRSGALHRIA